MTPPPTRSAGGTTRYSLDPALTVLLRPDGAVQIGWDPRRAVLVRPPDGLSTPALADLLRSMTTPTAVAELTHSAKRAGLCDPTHLLDLVNGLVAAEVVTVSVRPTPRRAAAIRIHGRGPLSDLVADGLACSGARVRRTSSGNATGNSGTADLVILADYLVADPHLVRELHLGRIPHLSVRVRDGAGLVGPLVLPGLTSCLMCADLHRRDRDAAWPAVAAQLRDAVGTGDRATMLATAAVALSQVDRVLRVLRTDRSDSAALSPPPTLDATLEVDAHTSTVVSRRWTKHPSCTC
ncbi:MAG: cyclodehydratase [Mycobacterium sp.]